MTTTEKIPTRKCISAFPHLAAFTSPFVFDELHEHEIVRAGWVSCRSCNCKGYTKSGDGSTCGTCSHHYSQHR